MIPVPIDPSNHPDKKRGIKDKLVIFDKGIKWYPKNVEEKTRSNQIICLNRYHIAIYILKFVENSKF